MAERVVELDSMELAVAIFGNCDQNIRMLENEFHVTAVCRGSQLKLVGEPEGVTGAAQENWPLALLRLEVREEGDL